MTLGIGLRAENGVVLVSDSLEPLVRDGRTEYQLDGRKISWLHGTDTAAVISGYVNDDELLRNGIGPDYQPLLKGLPAESDPMERPRRAYRRIKEIDSGVRARVGNDGYGTFDDPGPHVLFAVGRRGDQPALGKFTSKTEHWAKAGEVLTIGGWLLGMPADIAAEMRQPAPARLSDCRALAANWVRRFMDVVFGYRDAFRMARETGNMPCIGFPLQVLTMTDEHHDREVIEAWP